MSNENISVQLTKSEALVFFEFLARSQEEKRLEVQDLAEQRVLASLCSRLEKVIVAPSASDYDQLLREAREEVRKQQ